MTFLPARTMNKAEKESQLHTLPVNESNNHDGFSIVWFDTERSFPPEFDHIRSNVTLIDSIDTFNDYIRTVETTGQLILLVTNAKEYLDIFIRQRLIFYVYILNYSSSPIKPPTNRVGIFTDPIKLMQRLRRDMMLTYRSDFGIDGYSSKGVNIDLSFTNVDSYTGRVIWMQLFIYGLLRGRNQMNMQQLKDVMVQQLRIEHFTNVQFSTKLREFERDDVTQNPLLWYTKDTMIHEPMNRAFRTQNPELMWKFQYFLIVLHEQLERLSREQEERRKSPFTVYRCQLMGQKEMEILRSRVKRLICINTSFSTTTVRGIAEMFSAAQRPDPGTIPVLIEITIEENPNSTCFPYAFIDELSHFCFESEVLFFPGALFRLDSINRSIIKLTLCHESMDRLDFALGAIDRQLAKGYSEDLEIVLKGESDIHLFNEYHYLLVGHHVSVEDLLIGRIGLIAKGLIERFGEYAATINLYENLLIDDQFMTNHPSEKTIILNTLIGRNYSLLKKYDEALNHYEIALLSLGNEDHQIAGRIRVFRGDAEMAKTNLCSARNEYEQAIRIYHRCQMKGRYRARVYRKLAEIYRQRNSTEAAAYCERQAECWAPAVAKISELDAIKPINYYLQRLTSYFQLPSFQSGYEYYELALCLIKMENFPQVLNMLKKGETLMRLFLTDSHSVVHLFATLNEVYAYVYFRLNDFLTALIYLKRALDKRASFC